MLLYIILSYASENGKGVDEFDTFQVLVIGEPQGDAFESPRGHIFLLLLNFEKK
jgi:hypothetical protein